eukprot:90250_1
MNQNKSYKGNGLSEQQNNNNNNKKDDIYGLGDLAAPVDLGGARGVGLWKGSAPGGSTMVDTFDLSSVSAPQPMMAKQQQQKTVIQQQTIIMPNSAFGDLDSTPLSFGANPMSSKPQVMVLPSPDADEFLEFKSEPMFFVPSKCIGLNGGGLQATPAMYNEMTSVVVDESPVEVMSKFSLILDGFSNDIDYQMDEANYMISGQIFVRHFAVFFKISIWTETQERTRFEVRRSKGDSVAFNEFWNEMEQTIYDSFSNVDGYKSQFNDSDSSFDLGGLPPIDYNFDLDLDDGLQSTNLTTHDLDNFVADLEDADPSVVYSIAMLLDAFKVQSQFVQMIFNHTQFIRCIIDSALAHKDTALVRGALITLERLCESQQSADLLIQMNVLDAVVPLLAARCDLIRKYSVRVLNKLSMASAWSFTNVKMKRFAQISVKECQQKWETCRFATNDFIEQTMFDNITNKLIGVN